MKLRATIFFGMVLSAGMVFAQSDNSIYVKAFPGGDVGTKVTAAMNTCGSFTSIPCILIIDPSLAAFAPGTLPTLCSHCYLIDWRNGIPFVGGIAGSLNGANSAVVITSAPATGTGYTSCSVSLSGGTCSTAPTFACFGAGTFPNQTANVVQLSPGSCTVSPTAAITGPGTGASVSLALASSIAAALSGSGTVFPVPMTGGGAVVGNVSPFIFTPTLTNPILAYGSQLNTNCTGTISPLIAVSAASLTIDAGCGSYVKIGPAPSAQFDSGASGNETLFGGNLVFEALNLAYGYLSTPNEGSQYSITGSATIFANGGVPGSGYSGAGTCTLTGGLILSGTADTCSASIYSSGSVTNGIAWTISGTATYSILPTLGWAGATGGTGAVAAGVASSGTPSLTGSSFFDPTSTFHINTGAIPASYMITGPGTLTNDLFAVGPGVAYLPPAAPSSGGPNCMQIAVGGRITNTGSACGSGGSGGAALTAATSGGAAPNSTYNGASALTLDYHSFGAQANLSLLPGTYLNGDLCTYTTVGTLITCNTPTSTFQAALGYTPANCTAGTTGSDCLQLASGLVPTANLPGYVADTTVAVSAATQGANSCTSASTVTMSGLTTSMVVLPGYSSSPAALTGWGSSGGMVFQAWASAANTMSWIACNQTASSITFSAITFNVGAR